MTNLEIASTFIKLLEENIDSITYLNVDAEVLVLSDISKEVYDSFSSNARTYNFIDTDGDMEVGLNFITSIRSIQSDGSDRVEKMQINFCLKDFIIDAFTDEERNKNKFPEMFLVHNYIFNYLKNIEKCDHINSIYALGVNYKNTPIF